MVHLDGPLGLTIQPVVQSVTRGESEREDGDEKRSETAARQEEKNTRNYFAISSSSSIFNYDRQTESKQMQNPSRVLSSLNHSVPGYAIR